MPTSLEVQQSNLLMGKRNLSVLTPTPMVSPTTTIPLPFPPNPTPPAPLLRTARSSGDAYRVPPGGKEPPARAAPPARSVTPPITNWNNWLADARSAVVDEMRSRVSIRRGAIIDRVRPLVMPPFPPIRKTEDVVVNPLTRKQR